MVLSRCTFYVMFMLILLFGLTMYPTVNYITCAEPTLTGPQRLMVTLGIFEQPRTCPTFESLFSDCLRILAIHIVDVFIVVQFLKRRKSFAENTTDVRKVAQVNPKKDERLPVTRNSSSESDFDADDMTDSERANELMKLQQKFREHELMILKNAMPFDDDVTVDVDGNEALIPVMTVPHEELLMPDVNAF